tara:strand:+ start:463 stop:660 length:198 start_codon:yes stop_codon:yes gene_type:complete
MNAIKSWLRCLLRRDDIYVVMVNRTEGGAEALLATHDESEALEYMVHISSIHTSETFSINQVKLL